MKRVMIASVLMTSLMSFVACAAEEDETGFVQLWDGKTLDGWKASEHKESFSIVDGDIVAHGERSHLFYVGDLAPFKNFHFKCQVMTKPKANAGIYFHTKYQEEGWPKFGYEAQVNNSHGDPKKTGSLYAVENTSKANHNDNEWFDYDIIVSGRNIKIKINGKTEVDFTEAPDRQPGADFTRKLDEGTFAFQSHDPISEVHFKNIRVKKY